MSKIGVKTKLLTGINDQLNFSVGPLLKDTDRESSNYETVMIISLNSQPNIIYKYQNGTDSIENSFINEFLDSIRGIFMTTSQTMNTLESYNGIKTCLIEHQSKAFYANLISDSLKSKVLMVIIIPSDYIHSTTITKILTDLKTNFIFTFGSIEAISLLNSNLLNSKITKLDAFFDKIFKGIKVLSHFDRYLPIKTSTQDQSSISKLNVLKKRLTLKLANSFLKLQLPTVMKSELDSLMAQCEAQCVQTSARRNFLIIGSCTIYKVIF
jgi:hypothetical protein